MIQEKARKLMQKNTLDIKTRQGCLLKKTGQDCNIEVDADNITMIKGTQPTFRKNYQ